MWTGVTNGFAGIKLSGSPNKYGLVKVKIVNKNNKIINPIKSLNTKNGWKGILSKFLFKPKGLFDPVWWRNNKWIIVIIKIINGKRKWKV